MHVSDMREDASSLPLSIHCLLSTSHQREMAYPRDSPLPRSLTIVRTHTHTSTDKHTLDDAGARGRGGRWSGRLACAVGAGGREGGSRGGCSSRTNLLHFLGILFALLRLFLLLLLQFHQLIELQIARLCEQEKQTSILNKAQKEISTYEFPCARNRLPPPLPRCRREQNMNTRTWSAHAHLMKHGRIDLLKVEILELWKICEHRGRVVILLADRIAWIKAAHTHSQVKKPRSGATGPICLLTHASCFNHLSRLSPPHTPAHPLISHEHSSSQAKLNL